MPEPTNPFERMYEVYSTFDFDALKRICEMRETEFASAYGMSVTEVTQQHAPDNFYAYLDRGSDILAVAHLDTVVTHEQRGCNLLNTAGGPVVYSGALDDRLGAYTILELLPRLGVDVDVLLTVGEEQGMSTAAFFEAPKEYHWMIEFDRGGTDVVMYQYEDDVTMGLVEACGARVGTGSFSDIAFLEHLEVKGFNWGVGYQDYHGPRSHAHLEDYWAMVGHYLEFHETNAGIYLPHEPSPWRQRRTSGWGYDWEQDAWLAEEVDDEEVEGDEYDLVSEDWHVVNERVHSDGWVIT